MIEEQFIWLQASLTVHVWRVQKKKIETTQLKPVLRDTEAQPSVKQQAPPAAPWVVSWCCMVAPSAQRACTLGFGGYHQVVAVEKGGRGRCACDFSLSVCVSVRKSERESEGEQEIVKVLCEAGRQGKCFVLWEFSSGCQAPVLERWGDVWSALHQVDSWEGVMSDPYVGCAWSCGWILGSSAISGLLFKCLTAITAELLHVWISDCKLY